MVGLRASLGATTFTACTLMVNNSAVPDNKGVVNGFAQMINTGVRSFGTSFLHLSSTLMSSILM
jgi:hypothetical protein